jgi:(2Fe-2S) ferredoxin
VVPAAIAAAVQSIDTVVITPRAGALPDPAWSRIPAYRHHVLVCHGPRGSACVARVTAAVLAAELQARGLGDDDVLVAQTDCLYPCNRGPMLVVNPGDTWYEQLTPERVRQIVDQHLRTDTC